MIGGSKAVRLFLTGSPYCTPYTIRWKFLLDIPSKAFGVKLLIFFSFKYFYTAKKLGVLCITLYLYTELSSHQKNIQKDLHSRIHGFIIFIIRLKFPYPRGKTILKAERWENFENSG